VIALPRPGAGVGFATCTAVIGEVSAGSEGVFLSASCARGGSADKIPPVSAIFSQQRRARPATGRWFFVYNGSIIVMKADIEDLAIGARAILALHIKKLGSLWSP